MANLSYTEKTTLEELFGMSTGYVIDFSNNTLQGFIGSITGIDIYADPGYTEYCSKANKLRQFWDDEPDDVVGGLLAALLDYLEDYELKHNTMTDYKKKKIGQMLAVANRLKGNSSSIVLPTPQEETLSVLLDDINSALSRKCPELVLDRLHTFSSKYLRQVCSDNSITVTDNNGDYYPLHSLAGMLKKKYEQDALFQSSFTLIAIRNSISLFDQYNAIRNNQSYAHDNEVLDSMEAEFVVRLMANLLSFIDRAEIFRKQNQRVIRSETDYLDDLPF